MEITKNSVLLRLSFSKAGNERKASLESVDTQADKKRLSLTKKLYTCKPYKDIGSFDGKLGEWIDSRAIPCNIGYRGIKLLPLELLAEVETKLNQAVVERRDLVTAFMQVYDAERQTAKIAMKEFFNANNYPASGVVADKFDMDWWYVTFKVPENLPSGLFKEQQEKLEARFSDMEANVRTSLRLVMEKLMTTLADQLKEKNEQGKKRKFYDSSIQDLSEFLRLFSIRNVTKDEDLQKLADAAEQIIAGATGEKVRSDAQLRAAMLARADEVLASVKQLIKTEPHRKFKLEGSEDDEF